MVVNEPQNVLKARDDPFLARRPAPTLLGLDRDAKLGKQL